MSKEQFGTLFEPFLAKCYAFVDDVEVDGEVFSIDHMILPDGSYKCEMTTRGRVIKVS